MVKQLAILVALAATAHADPETDRAMLGFRMDGGAVPLDGKLVGTVAFGLTAEHVVAPRWRLLGEYEWVWLSKDDKNGMPEIDGNGQRAHVGVRRRLHETFHDEFGWFVDADLGVGFMLANDNVTGTHALPDGFVGLHAGYVEKTYRGASPSKRYESELFVRALALTEGIGFVAGAGMAWQ